MDSGPHVTYRPGGPADAPALARVLAESFETYREWAGDDWAPRTKNEEALLAERLGWDDAWCLVAEAAGRPVAYVAILHARTFEEPRTPIPGLAHLWHLFVLRDWWGSGVAGHLLREAVSEARRRGYEWARLWTPRDHARARAFYRREGWRDTGEEQYAPDLDLDIVEMRRPLGVMLGS